MGTPTEGKRIKIRNKIIIIIIIIHQFITRQFHGFWGAEDLTWLYTRSFCGFFCVGFSVSPLWTSFRQWKKWSCHHWASIFSATVDSCMEVRFSQFLNMTFLETFLTKLWTAGAEDRWHWTNNSQWLIRETASQLTENFYTHSCRRRPVIIAYWL